VATTTMFHLLSDTKGSCRPIIRITWLWIKTCSSYLLLMCIMIE